MDETIATYKATELYKEAVLPALQKAHEEQVKAGITTDEDIKQLSYPY
jgi:hypothetical protein